MNIERAKTLIRKTGNLLDNVGTQVSAVERDLLLDYVRQLYEAVLEPTDAPPVAPPPRPKPRAQIIAQPRPTPVPKDEAPIPELRQEPAKPRIIEVPDSLKHLTQQQQRPTPPPTPRPAPAPKPPQPRPVQARPTPPPPPRTVPSEPLPTPKRDIPESLSEVFKVETGKDLADRLASAPIRDLTKAMGLNERMFTVKELFGGNKAAFDEAMYTLNHLSSYEQAKVFLASNYALQNQWNSDSKLKKAQNFMKLVYRRYL